MNCLADYKIWFMHSGFNVIINYLIAHVFVNRRQWSIGIQTIKPLHTFGLDFLEKVSKNK